MISSPIVFNPQLADVAVRTLAAYAHVRTEGKAKDMERAAAELLTAYFRAGYISTPPQEKV